jgi:hypothetical protein
MNCVQAPNITHRAKRLLWLALFSFLSIVPEQWVEAQSGGSIQANIVNGTTGAPGGADVVTLYDLAAGMEAVAFAEDVEGSFTLEDIEVKRSAFLLQATYAGVNYSQTLSFAGGNTIEATVTVYDVTDAWDDIEIRTARFLIRREHDGLMVDKLYVVENKTEPKRTFYDPEGTLHFQLPPGVERPRSVSANYENGMPIPQTSMPLADGTGYATDTALKPGATDIAISYEVDYSTESFGFREKAFIPISELIFLVAPADIEVDAQGWQDLGLEPQGRFAVYQQLNVSAGAPIEMTLSGGSDHSAELVGSSSSSPSSSSMGGSGSSGGGGSGQQVITIQDPILPQIWIVVLLMGAALAYGLLTVLIPSKEEPISKSSGKSQGGNKKNNSERGNS